LASAAGERKIVTEPTKAPELDPLLDEALDWVVRLKTGTPIRADIEALQQWRDLSPAHEQAFKRAARLLRDAGIAARELADEQSAVNAAPASQRSPPQIMARRVVLGGTIAAAAAGYLVVRPPLDLWPSLEELSADYRTGKGEQRKVLIAADVSLELNTQTSVALRSARNETQIELISGEASVAAKRQSSRPLVMLAANGRITAVEANFNARCLDGMVSVACVDGVVDVMQGSDTVQLHKAEQVSYSLAGIEASVPVDPEQVGAWQSGLLIFRDKPLASVVNEVNRYRSGKIIITNADLKRRLVNGTFQLDKLENFVAQVQQLFGVRATPLLGGVVLLS
jgi:transmembrane sensor